MITTFLAAIGDFTLSRLRSLGHAFFFFVEFIVLLLRLYEEKEQERCQAVTWMILRENPAKCRARDRRGSLHVAGRARSYGATLYD